MYINNEDRAEFAAHACDQYSWKKEGCKDYEAPETIAADLICDLLHMIRAHDADPAAMLRMAVTNFVAEEEDDMQLNPNIKPFIQDAFGGEI